MKKKVILVGQDNLEKGDFLFGIHLDSEVKQGSHIGFIRGTKIIEPRVIGDDKFNVEIIKNLEVEYDRNSISMDDFIMYTRNIIPDVIAKVIKSDIRKVTSSNKYSNNPNLGKVLKALGFSEIYGNTNELIYTIHTGLEIENSPEGYIIYLASPFRRTNMASFNLDDSKYLITDINYMNLTQAQASIPKHYKEKYIINSKLTILNTIIKYFEDESDIEILKFVYSDDIGFEYITDVKNDTNIVEFKYNR